MSGIGDMLIATVKSVYAFASVPEVVTPLLDRSCTGWGLHGRKNEVSRQGMGEALGVPCLFKWSARWSRKWDQEEVS